MLPMSIAPGALWKNAMIGSLGAMSTGDGSAAICPAPSASGGDATTAGAGGARGGRRLRRGRDDGGRGATAEDDTSQAVGDGAHDTSVVSGRAFRDRYGREAR